VARIVAPWGAQGIVKAEALTDDPQRFDLLQRVYLGPNHQPAKLQSWRWHKSALFLKFQGYEDRTAAESLRGWLVQIPIEEALPLGQDEYYVHQIEGLVVETTDGEYLGQITEVLFTGANDVWVVEGPKGEIPLPALADVILEVDLAAGRVIVRLPPGLLD